MVTCPRSRHELTSQSYNWRCGPCLVLGQRPAAHGYLSKFQTWVDLSTSQQPPHHRTRSSWSTWLLPLSIIVNQCQSLSIIVNHCQSLSIIVNHCHCQSSSIIVNHCQSFSIIVNINQISQNTKQLTHLALAIGGRRGFGRQSEAVAEVRLDPGGNLFHWFCICICICICICCRGQNWSGGEFISLVLHLSAALYFKLRYPLFLMSLQIYFSHGRAIIMAINKCFINTSAILFASR